MTKSKTFRKSVFLVEWDNGDKQVMLGVFHALAEAGYSIPYYKRTQQGVSCVVISHERLKEYDILEDFYSPKNTKVKAISVDELCTFIPNGYATPNYDEGGTVQ